MEFEAGDRVIIQRGNFEDARQSECWRIGSTGTVLGSAIAPGGYCGSDMDDEDHDHRNRHDDHRVRVDVRWDNFQYASRTDHHNACAYILGPDEVDPAEIEATLRSIAAAIKES